ncbi:SAM-dependent methyltransferase [Rugosimonospora africana]
MHPARRYDYFLGGTTNFAADRQSGDRMISTFPGIRVGALENRRFLRRAVAHLVAEAGIRQFLDIGSGIPTSPNTHEVAQAGAGDVSVVYVDNDPIVLAHAGELTAGEPSAGEPSGGGTTFIQADLREPGRILDHPDLRATLDLSRPVALMLVAVLHFFPDTGHAHRLVGSLVRALAPGSYLVMSHGTFDFLPPQAVAQLGHVATGESVHPRSKAEFAGFFDGLELIDPGIVPTPQWRAENEPVPRPTALEAGCYAAVARIPG